MSKCVLRIAKMKTMGAVAAAGKHNSRERDTPNADPEKTPDNFRLDNYREKDALEAVQKLMPEKVRKNGVLAVEVVMSASPDFFQGMDRRDITGWASKCRDWVAEEFGGGQNVANFTVHLDEQTPHIHAIVVPLKNGKLNCRHYLGGTRDVLSKFQDRFAETLQKNYPTLERGEKGSVAEHTTVKEFYEGIQKAEFRNGPTITPIKIGPVEVYKKKEVDEYRAWVLDHILPKAQEAHRLSKEAEKARAEKEAAEKKALDMEMGKRRAEALTESYQRELRNWERMESEYEKLKGVPFKETLEKTLSDPANIAAMHARLAAEKEKGRGYGD